MMTNAKYAGLLVAGFAMAACGGAKKSGSGTTSSISGGPPPPAGEAQKIDRQVTRAAEEEFAEAVAYFQEKEKEGWNESSCKEASRRFEEVAESHNKMVEARYNSGLALQSCGLIKGAERQYQKALSITAHGPSLSNLGEIYFAKGDEALAKQYWQKAVSADPKIVAARNNLAWLLIRDVQDGKASFKSTEATIRDLLSSALAVDNDNIEAYTLYGLFYMQGSEKNKSRLTLAKLLLDKGSEINDKYPALHNARGLLLLRQDNVPQALESFRRAVALKPDFLEAHRNIGNIVLDFRKYDEALAEFQTVLKLNPKDYDALIGQGYAQRGLKNYDDAEASYKEAKKIDAARGEADYNLGVLYQDFRSTATQDPKEAMAALRQAITYFQGATNRGKASSKMKSEAKDNINICEKNIKSLEQAIKFQAEMDAGK